MHEEDKVGAKGAIDEKFTAPMTIRMLLAEEILLSSRYGVPDLLVPRHLSGIGNGSGQGY